MKRRTIYWLIVGVFFWGTWQSLAMQSSDLRHGRSLSALDVLGADALGVVFGALYGLMMKLFTPDRQTAISGRWLWLWLPVVWLALLSWILLPISHPPTWFVVEAFLTAGISLGAVAAAVRYLRHTRPTPA